jgi:hypothetical protein
MKQELGNLMAEDPHQEAINLLTYRINSLTTELTAARAKIERIDLSGIHTCHDKCQRWTCVLRRENKMLTEQRDRLAVALDTAAVALRLASKRHDEDRNTTGFFDAEIDQCEQALQSLNPKDHE